MESDGKFDDIDAGSGNAFQNVRVSCIAGPCPFTKIEPSKPSYPARKVTVSVLNWSGPATFLVEAEVIRTMRSHMVRELYRSSSEKPIELHAARHGARTQHPELI